MKFSGIVAGGSAKAHGLGYPTANIPLSEDVSGIYAALVTIEGKEYPSVAFADPVRKVLEAHLFDFSDNLYGKEMNVQFVKKIRESQTFLSDADLKHAMAEDAVQARRILS